MGMKKMFGSLLLGVMMFVTLSVTAKANYGGAFEYSADGTITQVQAGIMPSVGEVDSLVFLVEFPDIKHNEANTVQHAENVFFGEATYYQEVVPGTCETLADFFKKSSYGKLQLSGDVYGWYTAEHERAYYAGTDLEYPTVENLFWEVIDAFDEMIDFSKYDANNDGYVDSIYLVYAGPDEGWGSTFWTYVDQTICTSEKDGMKIAQYAFINERNMRKDTLAHESGHMLGLIDYYDYDKQAFGASEYFGGTSTIMLDNAGDYDAWAKILLGWIDPVVVTSDTTVMLRIKNHYPDAVIVRPREEKYENMFFVVEYINLFGYSDEECVRIHRINCTRGEEGGFKYIVSEMSELKPIERVYESEYNGVGGISPYQNPASFVICENVDGTESKEFTGISIKHGEMNAQEVACTITYEDFSADHKPAYEMKTVFAANRAYIELVYDIEMYLKEEGQAVTVTGGGQTFTMNLERNSNYEYHLYSVDNVLLPNTTYTVTIPAGCMVSYYGGENEAIVYTFTTDNFPSVGEYEKQNTSTSKEQRSLVKLSDTEYGIFDVESGKLYVHRYNANGFVRSQELAVASTKENRIVTACSLENGEVVIAVTADDTAAQTMTDIYRWDMEGVCEKVHSDLDMSLWYIYALGNNAILGSGGEDIYLLKDNNEIVLHEDAWITVEGVCNAGDGQFWICEGPNGRIHLVDEDFNVLKSTSYLEQYTGKPISIYSAREYNGYLAGFGVAVDKKGNATNAIVYYNSDYEVIGVEELGYEAGMIIPYEHGFVVLQECSIPVYNGEVGGLFGGWVTSPVMNVAVCDMNLDKRFSYTLDHGKYALGDMYNNFLDMGNGDIVLATKWCSYYMTDCDWEVTEITHPAPGVIEIPGSYIGNINSELISFDMKQNDKGAYYLTGQIVVVEWIDGVSTVPKDTPTMIFKSTDGTEQIDVFVTSTGTNTYYFDRFIEGLSPDKEYVFEIASGTSTNISPNRYMNVLLSTSPQMAPAKNLGEIGDQKISYYKAANGELRLYRQRDEYIGHINSELIKTELVKGPNGNYVSGQIVVVEWVDGLSTVPDKTPIMHFKSVDGLESLPVFVTPTGTNTYYFDRSLGDMDTSKEYIFTIESGNELNISPYRSMIVTTAAMTNKEGLLWQSDTQYVRYRTDANTGELRIYAVNK